MTDLVISDFLKALFMALIPTIPALIAVVLAIKNRGKIQEVHLLINSRMDAWLKVATDQAAQVVNAQRIVEVAQVKAASLISLAEMKADALVAAARPVAASVVAAAQPVAIALRTAAEIRANTDRRTAEDLKVAAMTTLDIVAHAKDTIKNAGLPSYHDGIAYVPKTGPAMLHEGEQIIAKKKKK